MKTDVSESGAPPRAADRAAPGGRQAKLGRCRRLLSHSRSSSAPSRVCRRRYRAFRDPLIGAGYMNSRHADRWRLPHAISEHFHYRSHFFLFVSRAEDGNSLL
ncbi:hypothetical protein MRX96_058400 [Rhipicephalus microplus]